MSNSTKNIKLSNPAPDPSIIFNKTTAFRRYPINSAGKKKSALKNRPLSAKSMIKTVMNMKVIYSMETNMAPVDCFSMMELSTKASSKTIK